MNKIILLLAVATPLAACGGSPQISEENASVGDVAAKVREASASGRFVRPGEWKSRSTIEEFEIPGMPKAQLEQMKQLVARNQQDFTTCLTAEDVEQPKGKFFTGNEQCRYDHFRMGDGRIDAEMRCPSGQGMTQVLKMTGTYSPERYDMQMSMTGEGGEGPAATMRMKMKVQSERVGECKAEVAANE